MYTFLSSKGIDLDHNRFLILQGEVEKISLMKPKGEKEGEDGLLEYLEDIIGSNKDIELAEKLQKEISEKKQQQTIDESRFEGLKQELQNMNVANDMGIQYIKTELECLELNS
jgi:structural maintenance of chromosome 4